nr:MAG TPA_asm: hypothetical protein [Caudoviricetes sp.]
MTHRSKVFGRVRLTKSQRDQISRIKCDLVQHGIRPERWGLDVLARGATVKYGEIVFSYWVAEEWPGYSGFTTIEKCVKVFIERN